VRCPRDIALRPDATNTINLGFALHLSTNVTGQISPDSNWIGLYDWFVQPQVHTHLHRGNLQLRITNQRNRLTRVLRGTPIALLCFGYSLPVALHPLHQEGSRHSAWSPPAQPSPPTNLDHWMSQGISNSLRIFYQAHLRRQDLARMESLHQGPQDDRFSIPRYQGEQESEVQDQEGDSSQPQLVENCDIGMPESSEERPPTAVLPVSPYGIGRWVHRYQHPCLEGKEEEEDEDCRNVCPSDQDLTPEVALPSASHSTRSKTNLVPTQPQDIPRIPGRDRFPPRDHGGQFGWSADRREVPTAVNPDPGLWVNFGSYEPVWRENNLPVFANTSSAVIRSFPVCNEDTTFPVLPTLPSSSSRQAEIPSDEEFELPEFPFPIPEVLQEWTQSSDVSLLRTLSSWRQEFGFVPPINEATPCPVLAPIRATPPNRGDFFSRLRRRKKDGKE